MIQLIRNDTQDNIDNVDISSLSSPKSLDQYEINIVDLNDKDIWRNKSGSFTSINSINDFRSLGVMLSNSRKAKNIIILPQDQLFYYHYYAENPRAKEKYQKNIRLKDMLHSFNKDILVKLTDLQCNIIYESTKTKIMNENIKSSFYFQGTIASKSVTESLGGEKVTTFLIKENQMVTTLELNSAERINIFLESLGLHNKKEEAPDWINDVVFYDDKEQEEKIKKSEEKIDELNGDIELSSERLAENFKYKSILYTNGDELVEVVFDILQTMLNYDLTSFVDEKNEDFIIELDDITFIGEIKGVTSNIKSENISQLDVHYQGYLDKLSEIGKKEDVKSILIMNHQRNRNISERQPVHEIQINLAKRNDSLIIETRTLLKLFEMFKNNELSTNEFRELLQKKSGILNIKNDWF